MPHIGLVLGNPKLGTYIWTMVASCFRNEAIARQLGSTILPARTVAEESAGLTRLVGQGVDAIVVKPLVTDSVEMLQGFDKVQAAGIPVITLDSVVDHPAVVCTVGADNWQAQALVATHIFERMKGRGKVVFLAADGRPSSGAARNASFHELLGRYPGIQLIYEGTIDWVTPVSRRTQGAEHVRKALEIGDFDSIVATNDEAALGAIDALAERKLTRRLVSGYDALPDGLLAIHDRRLTATIRQGPFAIARTAIDVALDIIRGNSTVRRAAVPVELVTAENAVEVALDTLGFMPALIEDLTENHEQQRLTTIALAAAKERLEERVLERTKELDARNRKLRMVLDHVGEALFTVDLEGHVSAERSAVFEDWFPTAAAGAHISSVIEPMSPDAAAWIGVAWEQLRDGWLPLDVALDQLPRRLAHRGRHFEIGYRPINGTSGLEQILVMISDVTEAVGLAQSEADQREMLAVFQHVVSHRDQFFEFFGECERLVQSAVVVDAANDRATLLRAIHTLKGICAMRGVASIVSVCHALEKKLAQSGEELDGADRKRLADAWSSFAARVRKLTGTTATDRIDLSRADLRAISDAIESGRDKTEVLRMLRRMDLEPAGHRLDRLANDARALSVRVGKVDLQVETEADDIRFDRKRWAPFWSAYVHLLRNAVDHGIESAEERLAAGKPQGGQLTLSARRVDGEVVIAASDDGRGLDWEAVRRKARSLGHDAETEAELLHVLLQGGVSTKEAANEISGRGAGVSACGRACSALGGRISLSTTPGQGTTFRFHFPADEDGDPSVVDGAGDMTGRYSIR